MHTKAKQKSNIALNNQREVKQYEKRRKCMVLMMVPAFF